MSFVPTADIVSRQKIEANSLNCSKCGVAPRACFMPRAEITMLHDEGNEIAAHSRAHPDLTTLTHSEMQGPVEGGTIRDAY